MTYQEALNFLNNLQSKGIRPGLGNIAQALAIFGFPQFQFPSVHLAGTNGKGSTASFITSVLIQAGYKVGLFISPHLHTVRERIQVGRIPIPKEDFAAIATEIIPRLPTTLTYFEFLTLMAFVYFASQRVDIAVIETGLGGRLDATNLIMPEVSVITNIGLEHEHWLGYTLKKITLEKAGIIKQSRPLVTGIKQKELLRIIKNVCRFKNAPLYLFGRNFAGRRYRNELYYYGLTKNLKGLHLGLMGVHQFENASLALATLELLGQRGFRIEEKDIREGLSNTFWPGRFEIVKPYPFMIVLDGAHNPDGMQALKDSLRLLNYKRLFLVLGIMHDKRVRQMVKIITPLASHVIASAPNIPRAMPPEKLEQIVAEYIPQTEATFPLAQAIEKGLELARPGDLVLITGSLYTVAAAREMFLKVEKD